jgi:putative flippase GtrA
MWLRKLVRRHHEAAKFLVVGGVCFLATVAFNYALKLTVLHDKPVTALVVANILSTILSYVLNREWSFRTRGGRERHHEAALFFAVSAIGIALTSAPLAVSRYVLLLRVPDVSRPVQEIADFVSGILVGTLIAMCFRLWAFKRFVFPDTQARPRAPRVPRPRRGPRSDLLQHPARGRRRTGSPGDAPLPGKGGNGSPGRPRRT